MRQMLRIMVIMVIVLGLFSAVSADDGVQLIGGDENSLRELVSRLAGQPVAEVVGGDEASLRTIALALAGGGPGWNNQPVTVYVAALAKDMPIDLPLPEKANLVGTVDRGQFGITVMLNMALTPQDVIDFYSDSLNGDGWKKLEGVPGASGFVDQPVSSQTFCYTNAANVSTGVYINAQSTQDNTTGTDISIYSPAEPAMCAGISEAGYGPGNDPYSLLPQLKTPEGIEVLPQFGGGGGGGGGVGYRQASIYAALKSDMAIADILAAYNDELKAIGWESISIESSDHLAYSGWSLKGWDDTVWTGTFTLTANPGIENQYSAWLVVQEVPPQK